VCLPRPYGACRLVPCLGTLQLTVYTVPPSLLIYQGSADLDQLKRCIPPVTFLLTVNLPSSLQLTRPTKPHQLHYSTHIHIYLPSNLHSSILYLRLTSILSPLPTLSSPFFTLQPPPFCTSESPHTAILCGHCATGSCGFSEGGASRSRFKAVCPTSYFFTSTTTSIVIICMG
jgi:hypothetical protein